MSEPAFHSFRSPPALPLLQRMRDYAATLYTNADAQGIRLFNIYALCHDDHAPLIKHYAGAEDACYDALAAHGAAGMPGATFARPSDRWLLWESRIPIDGPLNILPNDELTVARQLWADHREACIEGAGFIGVPVATEEEWLAQRPNG